MYRINTLVLGLEHFIDKIGYQASIYKKNDISVKYLVSDKSGTSSYYANKYSADVDILKGNILKKLLILVSIFFDSKPNFVELYDTGRMALLYGIFSKVFRSKLVLILRGGELNRHNRKKLSFNFIKFFVITKIAYRVIIKEDNILSEYRENGFPTEKVRFVGNAVPKVDTSPCEEKTIDILYLNSVRKSRNLIFLVEVLNELLIDRPNLEVALAGFNSLDKESLSFDLDEEKSVLSLIDRLNLKDKIRVFGFVDNPTELHQRSKVFLLPADVIYANYSLLESMSYGAVPIVANGEGASKIVQPSNGYVLPLEHKLWVRKINELLDDKEILNKKSSFAVKTINENFSMDSWFSSMMKARF